MLMQGVNKLTNSVEPLPHSNIEMEAADAFLLANYATLCTPDCVCTPAWDLEIEQVVHH